MLHSGDDAPEFTAPVRRPDGEITETSLEELLAEGPIVLAFFPGAFTSTCTAELTTFRDRLGNITDAGASLYGVSIDSPFSLGEFADQHDLGFPLIGDTNRRLVDAYDVRMDFEELGIAGVAKRSVFVVDESGTVTYAWVSEDPGVEPDYEAAEAAAAEA
jgi:peroxiredoxin